MRSPDHARPTQQVAFDASAIVGFSALAWWWVIGLQIDDLTALFLAAAATFAASLLADLGCGLAHWAADTWGSERLPLVGSTFIAPFREHHLDPKAITRHDFLETNGASASMVLPLLVVAAWLARQPGGAALFGSVWLGMASVLTLATNQIHKWAHADVAPRPVRWLQRMGFVLSPEAHAIHHVAPHERYYCITHGWLNGALDAVRFFRALELVIERVTGAIPRREDLGNLLPRLIEPVEPAEVIHRASQGRRPNLGARPRASRATLRGSCGPRPVSRVP